MFEELGMDGVRLALGIVGIGSTFWDEGFVISRMTENQWNPAPSDVFTMQKVGAHMVRWEIMISTLFLKAVRLKGDSTFSSWSWVVLILVL